MSGCLVCGRGFKSESSREKAIRYYLLHQDLAASVGRNWPPKPDLTKIERHRLESAHVRQCGAP